MVFLVFAISGALISTPTLVQNGSPVPLCFAIEPALNPSAPDSPSERIGDSDLVRLTVANSSELSRSFRVDDRGNLNLPLLREPVPARGLTPLALKDEIVTALRDQHLFVEPLVVVDVEEATSRQVPVYGAVNMPSTLDADHNMNLLKAVTMAGGLSPEAGQWIVVQQGDGIVQRISVRDLFDGSHPGANVPIGPGTRILVPGAEKVFVMGDVKSPGAIPVTGAERATVLQVLALAGGLGEHAPNTAWIYRNVPAKPQEMQIEVPLRKILDRKAPDIEMVAGDILFIPTSPRH